MLIENIWKEVLLLLQLSVQGLLIAIYSVSCLTNLLWSLDNILRIFLPQKGRCLGDSLARRYFIGVGLYYVGARKRWAGYLENISKCIWKVFRFEERWSKYLETVVFHSSCTLSASRTTSMCTLLEVWYYHFSIFFVFP